MKTLTLKNGTVIPKLGQGTWYLGENSSTYDEELETLRWGIEHEMTLIDTAEMYGEGAAERLVGDAIRPYDRSSLYIVSKVYPWNAGRNHIYTSLENSLKRLQTDYLDCYLLHWRGSVPLAETVDCMEDLVDRGLIRSWGVSNLDVSDMEELLDAGGANCVLDQVLYHLGSRGAEKYLYPWLNDNDMSFMAYCPLAQAGRLKSSLLSSSAVKEVAAAHGVDALQILLAFVLSKENMFTVPRTGSLAHVKKNREAADIVLSDDELAKLDAAFPVPSHVTYLDMQ